MNKTTLTLSAAIGISFIVLISFFALGLGKNPQQLDAVREGSSISSTSGININLPDLYSGATVTAADLPDGYFLLNVWGSWCPACHQEHPYLMQLGKRIPIIGVNWPADNPNEHQDAKRLLAQAGNPYQRVIIDDNGSLIIDLGVYGAPETFLIGPDKTILHRYAGPLTPQIWRSQFQPRIKDAP